MPIDRLLISSCPRGGTKGFTLIELLVVLLIISITTSFAVLALRGTDPQAELETEAKRLHAYLKLAADEAILQSKELGLLTQDSGYRFLVHEKGKWVPLADEFLSDREFNESIHLELTVNGQMPKQENEDNPLPHLWIFYTGEMTPFEITLRSDESAETYYVLEGSELGTVNLSQHHES